MRRFYERGHQPYLSRILWAHAASRDFPWSKPLQFLCATGLCFLFVGVFFHLRDRYCPGETGLHCGSGRCHFLTYGVARRTGLGHWTALLPVSLLAVDTVLLRGALVARGDMLELALMFLTFWLAAPFLDSGAQPRPVRLFCLGLASGFAVLSLHVSMGASLIFLVGLAFTAGKKRWKQLLPVLWGVAVPLLGGASVHWLTLA